VADPKPGAPRVGSFEEWAALIPAAIVYAGGPDVTAARPKAEASQTPEALAHSTFMTACWPPGCDKKVGARAGELVRSGFKTEHDEVPDGLDDFREAVRELTDTPEHLIPSGVKLGKKLLSLRGKRRGDWRIRRKVGAGGHVRWRIVDARLPFCDDDGPDPEATVVPAHSEPDPAEDFARE
jgi:hypothetical protein